MATFTFYYSAAVTIKSLPYLKAMPDFRPLHMLNTQFERKNISDSMQFIDAGDMHPLFIDSGAYSVWTGKQKENKEEYIDYLNSIDRYVAIAAQFDTITGSLEGPRADDAGIISARESWENYLHMYERMDSPHKLLYAFHQDEPVSYLTNSLKWKDKEGNHVGAVAISGTRDEVSIRNWAIQMMDVIKDTIDYDNKPIIHLFGIGSRYTIRKSIEILVKGGIEVTADATTHVMQAANGKMFVPFHTQPLIVSGYQMPKHPEAVSLLKAKDIDPDSKDFDPDSEEVTKILGDCPLYVERLPYKGGDQTYRKVVDYLKSINMDIWDIQHSPYARAAVNIYYMQREFDKMVAEVNTNPSKYTSNKKLF